MEEWAFSYFCVESMEPMGAIWMQSYNLQGIRWLFSAGHNLSGAGENLWEPGQGELTGRGNLDCPVSRLSLEYQSTTRMTGTWVIEIVNANPAFKKFGCGFLPEALSSTFPLTALSRQCLLCRSLSPPSDPSSSPYGQLRSLKPGFAESAKCSQTFCLKEEEISYRQRKRRHIPKLG